MQMATIDELEQRVIALELTGDRDFQRQMLDQLVKVASAVQMLRLEQISQGGQIVQLQRDMTGRLDGMERRIEMLQQDVGSLRNSLTDLRADIDAKFHAAASQVETIIALLKGDH